MFATFTLAMTLLAAAPQGGPAVTATTADVLKSLRHEHPRLIGLPDDLARVKKLIADDAKAAAIYRQVRREADKLLNASPIEYKLIGPRLLDKSRTCLARVYTLATVYRIDGDRRYADRAIREMLTAAAFPDWNPKHFLDTAEMTHALAIGYDWLFDVLSAGDRRSIRQAIVDKGLRQGEKAYRSKGGSWARAEWNWNQVCNGGMTLGALAVAEDEPQLAAFIVQHAVASVPIALKQYAPDGAWAEGPGYWNYATSYTVYMLAGLESALGTDFGLSRAPGFALAGDFHIYDVGPTRLAFNFADSGEWMDRTPVMYWLARKLDNPLYAWFERDYAQGGAALDLWWFDPRGSEPTNYPTDRWFHSADVVFFRSKWQDPRAVFVGFKAGDNKVGHSHLELGTFVLDAGGQRWITALGPDDYNLPGYFGVKRWTYYRLNTQGQNTLLIDGRNQDPQAVAPIVAYHSSPERAHAVADLSAAYAGSARHVARGVALLDRRMVLVEDELLGVTGSRVVWQAHTKAAVELQGDRAVLSQMGEKLTARILFPPGAKFSIEAANPPPPEHQNPEVRKLVIECAARRGLVRLAVLFIPGNGAEEAAPQVTPLAKWIKDRNVPAGPKPRRSRP
jgi:hypothetical protein